MFNKTILFYGLLACITIWYLLFYLVTNDDVLIVLSSSVGAESLEDSPAGKRPTLPRIYDINLKTEVIFQGLNFPTSFAFLGPDDILVLEKNTGKVIRIVNGSLIQDSLLDANVSTESERGLLGSL